MSTGRRRRHRRRPGRHHAPRSTAPATARRSRCWRHAAGSVARPTRSRAASCRRQRAARVPALLHRLPRAARAARRRPSLVTLQPRLRGPSARAGWPGRLAASLASCPRRCIWRHRCCATRTWACASRARRGLGDAAAALGRCGGSGQRRASFGDWLRRQRQSPAAVEAIWELITRPTVNLKVDDASLAQAAQVFQVGLLADNAAGDIGWAAVPLSEIHDRAAQRGARASGRQRAPAQHSPARWPSSRPGRLRVPRAGSGWRPAMASARAATGSWWRCPPARAVAAAARVRRVSTSDLADRLGSSPIINLHVVYDRRVLEHPFAASVGTPVQWVFDRTAELGTCRTGSIWPSRCRPPTTSCTPPPRICARATFRRSPSCCRGARGRDGPAVLRDPRARGDLPRRPGCARLAPGPAHRAGRVGARRCLDRHRLAGDDGGCGAQRSRGGARGHGGDRERRHRPQSEPPSRSETDGPASQVR